MAARIGIDTGGTFTDVVRHDRGQATVHKLPSTPDDPGRAVLAGIAAVRRQPDEPVDVVHGTTVGLNAVLTGNLARTAFITNRGFEDLIEIGRQQRTDLYALSPQRPVPPVPRELRFGVACRRGPGGRVEQPLTAAAVDAVVRQVRRQHPAAIAIGLLHSPAAPADEHRLAKALREALPDVPVTCSADLLPADGEYERYCAAILNAAIAPVVGGYTRRLAAAIGPGQLRLLRSSLGILPPAEATRFPARAMFSGPAGGVLATAQVMAAAGFRQAAAFDMGGTSADVCLLRETPELEERGSIAGLPLPLPSVAVHTVGCGGGSIAYADRGGALRVGPQSAGADPGPACYGRGDEPTVTDAHVVLGHLGERSLLGGRFPLDVDAAVRAVERLGRRLGLGTRDAAEGILTIADVTMARALLVITAERAVDPAAVPLCAYGGAGGLHAAGLVQRLGLPGALLPPAPGAFSALGLSLAAEVAERSAALRCPLDTAGRQTVATMARKLATAALAELPRRGRVQVQVAVRYRGQGAALWLPWHRGLPAAFVAEHQRRFGFTAAVPLEVTGLRARATLPLRRFVAPAEPPPLAPLAGTRVAPVGRQRIRLRSRHDLEPGERVHGPAAIEESTATTWVPRGFTVQRTANGLWLAPGR